VFLYLADYALAALIHPTIKIRKSYTKNYRKITPKKRTREFFFFEKNVSGAY
jgi:hypothetical protein